MRVVIDTNIWISYLIGKLLQEIDEKIVSKEIKIVVSEGLLKELSEVSNRPKFKNIFTPKRIKELFSLLDNYAVVIVPRQKINICRDAKDNFLLEIALEGNADYLLVLNSFHKTKIVSPKDFERILKRKR